MSARFARLLVLPSYPLMLILFGFTRFLCEFLRDNYKVFGNISNIALHAAFMFIVGVVWLLVLRKKASNAAKRKVQHKKS